MKRSFFITLAFYAALFALISQFNFSMPKELPKRVVISDIKIKKECSCKKCACKNCKMHKTIKRPPKKKTQFPKKEVLKQKPNIKPKNNPRKIIKKTLKKPKKLLKPKKTIKKPRKITKKHSKPKQKPQLKKVVAKKSVKKIEKKVVDTTSVQKTLPQNKNKSSTQKPHPQPPRKPSYAEQYTTRFASKIRLAIQKHKYYPRVARRTKKEGIVRVCFELTPQKEIENIEILQSSGHKILDKAAIKTINKARRDFPAPKECVKIIVPIEYKLR
ncbi:energy transducer TonB [Nitratiruptor tergarcus]|uniref:Protein TonB n=1 Tax=Nitratiruptor tergarcus DSM 16512 TaxID=1069081 RepID=A0A1W1WSH8_9BACT|nr:energy transducer TonB [Nitratiruptor tergarcus]SMC09152.1 protein TonB [Nitratiruptor tergarcus DSM 16512]